MRSAASRILFLAFASTLILAALASAWVGMEWRDFLRTAPTSEAEERILDVPGGAGPRTVARLLHEAGVVTDADRFALYLRVTKAAPGLRAGELRFTTALRPAQVREVLLHAPFHTRPVTFPEGLRIEEMAAKAAEAGFGPTDRYIQLARDATFITSLDLGMEPPPPSLEGILLPETYAHPRQASVESVLRAQVQGWKALWDERRRDRARALGRSPYEITVLASVIEKETGQGAERPRISQVFHNRLRRGMRLESDPTIIYGLTDYDGNIRAGDIRRPHPWNTYVIAGLPPTPIAGAGAAAIDAALWPADGDELFFVARGDGTHEFNARYEDHAQAVRRYQLRR